MILYSAVSLLSILFIPAAAPDQTVPQAAAPIPPAKPIPPCNSYRLQYDYPLSPVQRSCIWASNLLTTSAVFGAAFGAGYAQLFKTDPPQWGYGPEGYARSYGTRYAAGMSKATGEYLAGLILKEDLRPRLSHKHNPFARIWYAGSSLVVDRRRSGPRFAAATLVGAAASGFTGMAFYPAGSNTVADALERSGMSLAGSLAYAELYEFEPDIFKLLGKLFTPALK
jgi:hypothetical protein